MIKTEKAIKADHPGLEKIVFDYTVPKTLRIKLRGDWQISGPLPAARDITAQFAGRADIAKIVFDSSEIKKWDSGLVSLLLQLARECKKKNIDIIREGLPQGAQKLLILALTEHEKNALPQIVKESFWSRIGDKAINVNENALALLGFLGETALSFMRLIRGQVYFRWNDFIFIMQRCGADALPLISLISLLVGMILAFTGAAQLKLFGAQVYIADLVGIGMVRVMGAVMAGILMSGRTGASFAAELGIMQANEEIDALKTLGVNPVEFLVMPRVLALTIMMPLLTLYADFVGMFGGFVVSLSMFNINTAEYITHTQEAVKLVNVWIGLIHGLVFGIIISISGCFCGIKCEKSAAGVGEAATSAVVVAITGIVIATAVITYVCQVLGV